MYTNADFQAQLSQIRNIHTKIEVINMNGQIIDSIGGLVVGGNVNISNANMVRRTLDITFISDRKTEIGVHSCLWINKKLKCYIGIEDYYGEIHWYNYGIFMLSNPSTDISESGRYISIKGNDLMEKFNRPFMYDTKFTVDTKISDAIQGLCALVGEENVLIEDDGRTLPYDLQFNPTGNLQDGLKDIVNLYMDYHAYYNTSGFFVFEKIKNRINDLTVWEFSNDMDVTISRSIITDYDSIKNRIKVIGKLGDDGILPMYEIKITGYDNILSIENIGERISVIEESKYVNEEQCKSRCEYEIEQSQNLVNTFTVEGIPIYLIDDCNKRINLIDNDVLYKCLIDSISMPLGVGTMTIQCHEIFN